MKTSKLSWLIALGFLAWPLGALATQEPDPAWTVQHSRSAVELVPTLRVNLQTAEPTRPSALQVRRANASDRDLGDASQAVVFNHAMQGYGALTGEISFRVAAGTDGAQLAAVAGLRQAQRIGLSDYWVGRTDSPQALRDSLLRLRATPGVVDAQWVVIYGLSRKLIDNARDAYR